MNFKWVSKPKNVATITAPSNRPVWKAVGKKKVKTKAYNPESHFRAAGVLEVDMPKDYEIVISPETLGYLIANQVEDYNVEIGGGFEVKNIDGRDVITYALKSNTGSAGYVSIDTDALLPAFIINGKELNGLFHTHVMQTFWSSTDLIGDGSNLPEVEMYQEVPVNEEGLTYSEFSKKYYTWSSSVATTVKDKPKNKTKKEKILEIADASSNAPGQLQTVLAQYEFVKSSETPTEFFFLVYSIQPLSFKVRKYMLDPVKGITYFDTYAAFAWENNVDLSQYSNESSSKLDPNPVGKFVTNLTEEQPRYTNYRVSTTKSTQEYWESGGYEYGEYLDWLPQTSLTWAPETVESTLRPPVRDALDSFVARPDWKKLYTLIDSCLVEYPPSKLGDELFDLLPDWSYQKGELTFDEQVELHKEIVTSLLKKHTSDDIVALLDEHSPFVVMLVLAEDDNIDEKIKEDVNSFIQLYLTALPKGEK